MTRSTTHGRAVPVAPPPTRGLPSRARHLLRVLLRPFWVLPSAWCALALALGLLTPELPRLDTDGVPWLFPGDVEGARSVLSTIAGAMISVTGLVFSNTMVVLQLASSQYSPRVLRSFLENRTTQHTLGLFAGSFVYALTVLRSLEGSGSDDVPQLAITLAYLWVLAALGMFLAFIDHVTGAVGVDAVLEETTRQTRRLVDAVLRAGDAAGGTTPDWAPGPSSPDPSSRGHVVTADCSGYLDGLLLDELVAASARAGVLVEVLHPLGTFVVAGDPLALVHREREGGAVEAEDLEALDALVRKRAVLGRERSMEQDLGFGLRRLVDIADKALSPGVNDPTTAVQVIDRLHELLRPLVVAPPVSGLHVDDEGVARVRTREPGLDGWLRLAVEEIAHWGADSVQVPRRLRSMLESLAAAATPENRTAVEARLADLDRRLGADQGAGPGAGQQAGVS
ncbi:DUF2254 domain-containing protein [Nocardioides sp. GY 10127]|uniref:DUF2254 domain-containing protein n=1 Tax=Nocardioides sp. GY 10127 TaxID=2569762 RepID=UPI0010A7525C|nr:DUF2254 domain-containing protein [Nocardioides sp. GY 10127]TIC80728.1 DUF2254 domain-containing protein [Nocardioides sp. GY 10127]